MKMNYRYILIVLTMLIYPKLSAQENLDSLLKIAAQNNPSLKAKYNKYLADLQKVPQVGSLPDLDVSFGFFIKPMELIGGNQTAQIQAMQMFPWFGTLRASKDEASLMALSTFELFNVEKQEIFYNVRTNYYQLFLNQKQMQVYDTTLVLLKSIEQLLLVKMKTINTGNTNQENKSNDATQGNKSMGMNANKQQENKSNNAPMNNAGMGGSSSVFADLLRIQVEIKELEDNIASLKNQKRMLTIQINTLLKRDKETEILVPDNLPVPEYDFENPSIPDSVKANNPMIKMNKADIEAYKQRQKMNRKMGYPMIGLGLNYSLINKSEMSTSEMNGKDMFMPMVNLKLPIYRRKYNASVKEAELLESSATDQLANTENMLLMELSEYQIALRDAKRGLLLYNDITSLTQKSFDILLVQYSSSGADFDAIIRLHRQLLDYRLNIIEAQVEQLTAIAGFQKLLSQY
ncbi:MAG: TolC family protein [Bacteroidales bacterium]